MKNIETCIISAGNNIPANKDDLSKQLQQLRKFINFGRSAEEFSDLHVHVKLFKKKASHPQKNYEGLNNMRRVKS